MKRGHFKSFSRFLRGAAFVSLSLMFGARAAADAGAWPMFRGDQRMHGVATGELTDKPVLLWRFPTEGPINSSAAIADGRVFVGSDDGNVYALDLKTGKKFWSFKTGARVEASPLYLRGKIYVGSEDTCLYCLDAKDGTQLWKFQTGDKILAGANWIDTNTTAGTLIVVGSYDRRLYGVNADSGKPAWNYETENFINGSAAIDDGLAVFGGCDGIVHLVSAADGRQRAEINVEAYIAGSIAVEAGKGYVGHYQHAFVCVDLDGKRVAWKYRDKSFPYFSSAALTGDRVVFGGRDKQVHCLDRTTGRPLWTFRSGAAVDSSPVILGSRVIVGGDDGRLSILDLNDGDDVWIYEIGDKIFATPAVADGTIVVGSRDGSVYAFGAAPPKPE